MANPQAQYGRFGSGHAVRRIEDPTLVTGTGRFVDDVSLPGQATLCFLRSPYPHARIASIDPSAALSMPGVIAVITGAQLVEAGLQPMPPSTGFPRPGGAPPASPPRHVLAHETVRFVGEAVAAVIAGEERDLATALSPPGGGHQEELTLAPLKAGFDRCPECEGQLVRGEGCRSCPSCGLAMC